MKIEISRLDDAFHMQATNEEGKTVEMDAALAIGGHNAAMRPMQMVLAALGGCSAIDVIDILKKQRLHLKDIKLQISAKRAEGVIPAVFTDIHMHFILTGDIPDEKAARAIQLSVEKYCSVAAMLRATATISHSFETLSIHPHQA
ncbi:MAG: OsmC family protein [Cytophagales bacterium]|nr:OsmC family protein [Bernardetiaceae bacterium]MDW8205618.1 OsmC family protein [Cytophagales bacterium]